MDLRTIEADDVLPDLLDPCLGVSPGPPPGAGDWCGCNQKWRPCREYTFMEHFPQRGSVPQIGVFRTPRLWNNGK